MKFAFIVVVTLCGCFDCGSTSSRAAARPATTKPNAAKSNAAKSLIQNKVAQPGTGTFAGRIVFDGRAPKIEAPAAFNPQDPKTDKYCRAHRDQVVDLSLIVDPKTKGIQHVFVYPVKMPPGVNFQPAPKKPVKLRIENCTFHPPAVIVRVGQKIIIENHDQTSHNPHTNPINRATQAYGKSLSPGPSESIVYDGAEKVPVKVVCDLHNWMVCYHLPLDHDFAALTDKQGRFKISGLPPGDYTFRVYHARAGYLERDMRVTISGPGVVERQLKYEALRFD